MHLSNKAVLCKKCCSDREERNMNCSSEFQVSIAEVGSRVMGLNNMMYEGIKEV